MIDIAYTQHCGNNPNQQDALWFGEQVFQENNLPVESRTIKGDTPFITAVADGVASSPMPHRASRLILELLADEISSGAPLITPTIRRIHGHLCDALAKGKTFGSATTFAAVSCLNNSFASVSVGDSRVYRISTEGKFHRGDSTLVCTDGVHDILGAEKLEKLMKPPIYPSTQLSIWRKAILKLGAPDHFSMLLIRQRT